MFISGILKNTFSKNYSFVAGVIGLILLAASVSPAARGNLDRTFGGQGKSIPRVAGTEKAFDAVVQTDGKIVVVGGAAPANSSFDILVERFNADGTFDAAFGDGGRAVLNLSPRSEVAYAVALQSDGKILVAGYYQQATNYTDFVVVRLLPNGQPDPSFGQEGVQLVAPTVTSDIAVAIAVQNVNGVEKIVVGGNTGTANTQFCAVRLNPDGALDTAFGNAGMQTVSVGGITDSLQDLTIDSQGRIVEAGFSRFDFGGGSYRDDFAVVRLTADGALDPTFSGDGKVVTQMAGQSQPRSVAMQTVNGVEKIVVGGFTRFGATDDFSLLRYNADGAVDTTFGTNGKVYTDFSAGDDQLQKLLVQSNGKITAVGLMRYGANQNFAQARYEPNGALDKTFGACGRIVTDLGSTTDIAYGAAIQPDGRVIAVGEAAGATTGADFAVVRYTIGGQAGPIGADFDGDGKDDVSVYRPSTGVWYANCSCQGFRAVQFGLPADVPVAADYDGDGRTDQAVYRSGMWYILRSSDGGASVVGFGLAGDVPTVGDYDGDEKADISVWRPSTGVWYVLRSSDFQYTAKAFGQAGDKPVPADYDGDGKTDLAVYRNGEWWIDQSSSATGGLVFQPFGIAGDTALAGDFDGDGKADLNLFRDSEGNWYQQSATAIRITHFGATGDKPAPGDYDGDGKTDLAVYRGGAWYILNSSTSAYNVVNFGLAADLPTVGR
ncbi:MAG: VCBS repeat-containing protein [Acidobacteria bacterium]|nr:VCBS repeat-containing protein [Acidobacteriota bacterium]